MPRPLTCLALLLLSSGTAAAEPPRAFIEAYCASCHSGEDAAGGIDLSNLSWDASEEEVARRWILVHDRVRAGEMPPAEADPPDPQAKKRFLGSLAENLRAGEASRSDVVLRRLNRIEYENTVRDLFFTDVNVEGLPEDATTDGFDTVGEGLAVSAEAMQAYLEAADQVLDAVFGPPEKPPTIRHETNLLKQVDWKGRPQLANQIGKMFRETPDGLVIFQSGYCPTNLVNFARLRVPAGTYRGTIRARAIQSDKPVTMRIYGGDTIVNRRERHLVGYFDVPPEWTTIEFTDRLVEAGGTFQPKCYGTRDTRKNANTYPEPGIEIGDIVIEGPLEPWPPISRLRLLEGVDLETATTADARRILERLAPRAFRRPIRAGESDAYVALFENARQQGRSFEAALRVSLKAVLCSPDFLFLAEPNEGPIDDHALATRLSYFLWSTMPDDRLRTLADRNELHRPEILRAEVERMLDSPKAKAFTENFTGQWLNLRDIDFTEPDANLYPEFDELLRLSMVRETHRFFDEVLQENMSLVNFVDSKFTFLNSRLAKHYGIEGVEGLAFRRVALGEDSPRGGLLGQASVLKVTANGTYTSPVQRGVWILDRILGQPTSPPPDNVGSVEPDIRGATTLREQLAKHRNVDSCSACHRRIDPPGFALECFDPIGGFREHYRTMAEDAPRPSIKQAPFTYNWVRYRIGSPVDATTVWTDGRSIDDIATLKRVMADDPGQLTRNLARKLLTYALGRRIGFSDRPAVERIVAATREDGYGFRSLIHQVVQSPVFRQP